MVCLPSTITGLGHTAVPFRPSGTATRAAQRRPSLLISVRRRHWPAVRRPTPASAASARTGAAAKSHRVVRPLVFPLRPGAGHLARHRKLPPRIPLPAFPSSRLRPQLARGRHIGRPQARNLAQPRRDVSQHCSRRGNWKGGLCAAGLIVAQGGKRALCATCSMESSRAQGTITWSQQCHQTE